jgi:hypothetical protein
MDKTRHQFKHTRNSTEDTDNHSTNNNTTEHDNNKDTDHRNKRQRTTEPITKCRVIRSDQVICRSDDHQDQGHTKTTTTTMTNEDDDTVLSEVHIHPDNGLVDRRTITSTFLLSRKGQPVVDSRQSNLLDNNSSKSREIMAQGDENDKDEDEHEEESDPWDYAVEIKHAMGTDLRGVGKSDQDLASLPRRSSS